MRIVLVRHGESEGNIDDSRYADVGDAHIGLTENGQLQLEDTGKFLRYYYRVHARGESDQPQRIWVSPYKRTEQSAALALQAFNGAALDVRRDRRLVEQSYGLLPFAARSSNPKHHDLIKALAEISREVHKKDPFLSVPPLGEAPVTHHARVGHFLDRVESDRARLGIEDILIISHGATNKHIIMHLMDLPFSAWKEIELQNNGDVTVVEDRGEGWTVRKIYDGPSRRIALRDPLKNVKLMPVSGLSALTSR
ncbi:MAG: histidine phosphatase family protein [Micavibrio aeruginosavorus]|uniref:Histidine phosphatase family protein n=1 Tax=Micavibrio aeruginosavorus TaxID=349221 RepID=A0A7T5R2S6_9BACT|nr:MAG: histidine phosphatase family protein [Micavibrio aeruginosavorus]